MSLSRRSFVQTVGAGAAGWWISSRGQEGLAFAQGIQPLAGPPPSVILSSNENPLGCHPDVLAAVKGSFAEAGRYPFATLEEVTRLIAKKHGVSVATLRAANRLGKSSLVRAGQTLKVPVPSNEA